MSDFHEDAEMRTPEICPGARACGIALWEAQREDAVHASIAADHAAAERMATLLDWDVERLQFVRDKLFWGNSTARAHDLPTAELALAKAKERAKQ